MQLHTPTQLRRWFAIAQRAKQHKTFFISFFLFEISKRNQNAKKTHTGQKVYKYKLWKEECRYWENSSDWKERYEESKKKEKFTFENDMLSIIFHLFKHICIYILTYWQFFLFFTFRLCFNFYVSSANFQTSQLSKERTKCTLKCINVSRLCAKQ